GDKAYESNSTKEFLKGKKIINEIISKEEPKTTAEKRKRKKLNSKIFILIVFSIIIHLLKKNLSFLHS
ncbi:MAG: hypothetical protein ACTSRG_24535, partial [Candidatus Helarchaeota archaeon]